MRTFEVPSGDINQKIVDVPSMLARKVAKWLNKCEKEERLVNWFKLKEYVMEFFMVADYRAEQAIRDARIISIYGK